MAEALGPGLLKLEIGNRAHEIKLTFDLIARIEETFDKSILTVSQEALTHQLGMRHLAKLVQAITAGQSKPPTWEAIGEALIVQGARDLSQQIGLFLARAYLGHREMDKFDAQDEAQDVGNVLSATRAES